MATLDIDFDTTEQEPDQGRDFTPLPSGTYPAMVTGSDVKQAKTGGGTYAKFEFTIIDGQYANRKVWSQITLTNQSSDAMKIGKAQLTSLCLAVGHVGKLNDTAELHDRPLLITLKITPAKGDFAAKNDVTKYASVNGSPAPVASSAPAAAKPVSSTPPWMRK